MAIESGLVRAGEIVAITSIKETLSIEEDHLGSGVVRDLRLSCDLGGDNRH